MKRTTLTLFAVAVAGSAAALSMMGDRVKRPNIVVVRGGAAATPSLALVPTRQQTTPQPPAAQPRPFLQVLVPAYFYPNDHGYWDFMTSWVSARSPITAIMNPNSGPGPTSGIDFDNYVRETGQFRQAGGTLLGYVPTGFVGKTVSAGCTSANGLNYSVQDVVNCALRYGDQHTTQPTHIVDGVFLDQMDNPRGVSRQDTIDFYTAVYDGIKAMRPTWIIIGNPGTKAPQGLLRNGRGGALDTMVTFEDYGSQFEASQPARYASGYSADRFVAILHSASNSQYALVETVRSTRPKNYGYIYITDDLYAPPPNELNPYDRLPTRWTNFISLVRKRNHN